MDKKKSNILYIHPSTCTHVGPTQPPGIKIWANFYSINNRCVCTNTQLPLQNNVCVILEDFAHMTSYPFCGIHREIPSVIPSRYEFNSITKRLFLPNFYTFLSFLWFQVCSKNPNIIEILHSTPRNEYFDFDQPLFSRLSI